MTSVNESNAESDAEPAAGSISIWQRFGLSLPGQMEVGYREYHRRQATKMYRVNTLIILVLWLLVSTGVYALTPATHLSMWLWLYVAAGIVVALSGVLSWVHAMEHWFTWYQSVACFVAVALSITISGLMPASTPSQLIAAAIIFCMVSVYALAGLPLFWALVVACSGGVAGVLLLWLLGGSINPDVFLVTYGGGSWLGVSLAYHAERHARALFKLQMENVVQLEQLSSKDPLTGLANRRHLSKALDEEWRRAYRKQSALAIMMIDVDHFKQYNDHYGHLMGDECLRTIATVIARYARRPSELAVRYGGDEFLLLLPDMDMNEAMEHADRLLTDIRAAKITHAPGERRPTVCVSIGLAVAVPFDHWKPGFLVDCADSGMYAAKHDGGDCFRLSGLRLSPNPNSAPIVVSKDF